MKQNFYSTYDDENSLATAASHLKLCIILNYSVENLYLKEKFKLTAHLVLCSKYMHGWIIITVGCRTS
jgi:hypothetical protein